MFYTLVLQFYLKNGQKEKRRRYFSEEKKTREKQNIATTMKSVYEKGTVFLMKLKFKGEWVESTYWKIILKKI